MNDVCFRILNGDILQPRKANILQHAICVDVGWISKPAIELNLACEFKM